MDPIINLHGKAMKEARRMLELLATQPPLRRFFYALLAVVALYAMPDLIAAIAPGGLL